MRTMGVLVCAVLLALLTAAPTGERVGTTVRSKLAGESVRLTLPTGEAKGRQADA